MVAKKSLLEVAAELADGAVVDWESVARSIASDDDRRLLAELQFISSILPARPLIGSSASPTPADGPTDSVVDSWGPLRIIELVGRGTFGDVYRAWDTRLDREVALKILRRREHVDEARASAVVGEGRLLARVRHPNVVTVYGAERIGGQVGVWMEFIHGKTLEIELCEHGPFAVDRVVKIGIQLADALSTVHQAGLVHADVKTQNVMSEDGGRLVLTDFGAGSEFEETPDDQARELAGTPLCVAPEVLAGKTPTPMSDIYSLGVLLYHLITGTYPVRGRSLNEVREAHASGMRTPLRSARPDLQSAFVNVVDRALDPHPDKRYISAAALGTALASLHSGKHGEPSTNPIAARPRWGYVAIAATIVLPGLASLALWRTFDTPVLPVENVNTDSDVHLRLNPAKIIHNANRETHDLYLKGRARLSNSTVPDAQIAAELFEQAIANDPAFAPAYAGLVDAWASMSINAIGVNPDRAFAVMEPAARKALELDPLLPEAHAAMGVVLGRSKEWKNAEAVFRRAIELNGDLPHVYRSLVVSTLWPQGKVQESLNVLRAALNASPRSLELQRLMAHVQVSAGQYDESIEIGRRLLAVEPDHSHTRQVLARALFQKGERTEAIRILEQLGAGSYNFLGYAYGATGRRAEAEAQLRKGRTFPARSVLVYAGLGDRDRTFEALEQMATANDPRVGSYLTYPELAFIREDARISGFRARLGLAD